MSRGIVLTVGVDPAQETTENLLSEAGFDLLRFDTEDDFASAAILREPFCILFFEISDVEIIRTLRERLANTAVIVIVDPDQAQLAISALKLGATDVWCRPYDPETLLPPLLESAGIVRLEGENVVIQGEMERRFASLSFREKQVLDMVVLGLMSRQIAETLDISTKTVDVHRANILKKTGASNAVELARIHATLRSYARQGLNQLETTATSPQETRNVSFESAPVSLDQEDKAT